jgi:hypothetical protein
MMEKSGSMVGTAYPKSRPIREILFLDTISTIDKLFEHMTAPLHMVSSWFLPILFVNTLYTSLLPKCNIRMASVNAGILQFNVQ